MVIRVLNLIDGHLQIYGKDTFSQTKLSEVKSVRKDVGKKKEGHERKKVQTIQISSPKARKEGRKKETGKATFSSKVSKKGRLHIQSFYTTTGRIPLRSLKWEVSRSNTMWTLNQEGKAKRKVGRVKLSRPVQLPQLFGQHGAPALHKLVSKKLRRTPLSGPRRKK